MKIRKISAVLVGAMVLTLLSGCGKKNDSIKEMQGEYSKYVTLGDYKGVEYVPSKTEITDDDIQYEIDSLVEQNTVQNQIMDRAATEGDTVNIDYVGYVDGEAFEGGDTQGAGTEIEIGNSGYIEGFDVQIIGHTPGDAFDLPVKFPDDYGSEELAGKDAVFETTLNYIVESVAPEYNDELVATATDYKTTAEFESAKRAELEKEAAENDLESDKQDVMMKVVDASDVSQYPETEVNERIQKMIDSVSSTAQANGVDLQTYLSFYGYDEEAFKSEVKESVEEFVKEKMIVVTIAEQEKIEATDEEVEAKKQELLDDTGMTDIEQLKAQYGYEDEDFAYDVLFSKVQDFVFENATPVEASETDAEDEDVLEIDDEDYELDDEDAEVIELDEDDLDSEFIDVDDSAIEESDVEMVDDYGTEE